MIRLIFVFFVTTSFLNAEEPINYIKHRTWYSGFMGLDDYFLIRKIKYNQENWYIMNPATLVKHNNNIIKDKTFYETLLADDSRTMLSINEEDLSECLKSSNNKVRTFFPTIFTPENIEMNTEDYKDVFKCFCKAKPDKLNEHGFLYRIDPIKIFGLEFDIIGNKLNILYCRNGDVTEEGFIEQLPAQQIAKFFNKVRW
ncbi:MAG: hypothetical protein WCQ47_04785 [bacterium]